MVKRKPPVRHSVSSYQRRDGTKVGSHEKGSGTRSRRSSRVVGNKDVQRPREIHSYDDLLKEWLEESGVDFVDFDDPVYRLIDSGWFEPKRSFDEFVREKIGSEELRKR